MFLGSVELVALFHPQIVQRDALLSSIGIISDLKQRCLICFGLMENKTEITSEKSDKKLKCSLVACELDLRLPPQINTHFVMSPRARH